MPIFTIHTVRERLGAGAGPAVRIVEVVQRQPNWVTRAAASVALGVFTLVALTLTLVLVVPALVIGIAVFGIGAGIAAARRRLAAHRPNGPWDGRRNVRVMVREE